MSDLPVSNVSINGNTLTYTSNTEFTGVMLMNSQLNAGAGPPIINIQPGSNTTTTPVSVGGNDIYHLFYQGRRISPDFISTGTSFLPSPTPMNGPPMNGPPMNGPPMNGPPMNGPPMNPYTEIIFEGVRRIPDGYSYAQESHWFFGTKSDGAAVVLPPITRLGQKVIISNWASCVGFGPNDARPFNIQHNKHVIIRMNPGEFHTFVSINSSTGPRWATL